jgi:alginate O-acetyltransferase complex protein AlgI
MLFCSREFLIFFAGVFCLYWAVRWHRARVWLLLVASFYFYASWNKWLALIIVVSTTLDYLVALGMDATERPVWRRSLLGVSLAANLGLLCYFKYANFFLRSLEEALQAAGATASLPVLRVILPVGISFYTFEAINYTVDVYRRRMPAERNLANFMLFILFFPHLVAGPIVRARDFLPQVNRRKRWDWPRLHLGMQFLVMGLFKKLAIADRMALFADPVFADTAAYGTGACWLAAVAYALQVYCDFSGYSDMALGCAHMLGYKLVQNFDMPFLAPNLSDFWRRWHSSLSTWIRDYLFLPMGGSRGSRWQTYRNLIVTMTLMGLWHGANWPMVAFGFLQGCALSIHHAFRKLCDRWPRLTAMLLSPPGTVGRVAFTFLVFCTTLAIFRSPSLSSGLTMWRHMATPHAGLGVPLPNRSFVYLVIVVVVCHALGAGRRWKRVFDYLPAPVRGFSYATALTTALVLAPELDKAFIYFQF